MSSHSSEATAIEPHIYAAGIVQDEKLREDILAFAARHGFSIAGPTIDSSESGDYSAIRETLQAAKDRGIENVMINNGRLGDRAARALTTDEDVMDEHLCELEEVIRVYAEYYPEGRVFAWHEAPLFGGWEGDTLAEMTDDVLEHGPEIFRAQKARINDIAPGLDVGIFIHHPFLPGSDHTDEPLFEKLVSRLADLDSMPDFTYIDMYRGYYEWEAGYDGVNDYLAAIIENVSDRTEGRPIHYLGEAHTINNHYTPSKQAIVGNFRTALEAGVDGYGWYVRGSQRDTHERCYNPFLPNKDDDASEAFNTWTGSRDRFLWANLLTAEHATDVSHDNRFDLWLYGHDFNFHEYELWLRRCDGESEFIGNFGGYVDNSTYSATNRDAASVFHGLRRERFLSQGHLELTVEPGSDSDGSELLGVYVVPHGGTTHYRTEPEVTTILQERDSVVDSCLGAVERNDSLSPSESYNTTVPIADPDLSISDTSLGNGGFDLERLRQLESSEDFTHADYFDLWVYGNDLEGTSISLQEADPGSTRRDVTDLVEATEERDSDADALVLRGLKKDDWYADHSTGSFLGVQVEAGQQCADVKAIYAMPYHGSYNYKTPAEIAAIIDRDHEHGRWQIGTFSLGKSVAPTNSALRQESELKIWVHIDERRIYESEPFDYHPSLPWPPWYLE